jgi:nucleoside-diphosphate-sugar epimerase
MSRILITGHKGYIGEHLFRELKSLNHDVLGIDTKSGNSLQECWEKKHKEILDFCPEYLFHLACWPRVGYSVDNPYDTMKNNVLSTTAALEIARECKTKRFIFSSSSAIYGNGDGPENPYALHKKISELECVLYSKIFDLDTVCLRYFNVYSEDQRADGPYTTAIANWMDYIRARKNPFITGSGNQKRDMVHVKDIVSANLFCMDYGHDFKGQNFDVGTGTNISLNEIKQIVNEYFPEVDFDIKPDRPNEVENTLADTNSLKKIGWDAKVSSYNGIHKCFKNLRKEMNK